jgi:hypothetical protein
LLSGGLRVLLFFPSLRCAKVLRQESFHCLV